MGGGIPERSIEEVLEPFLTWLEEAHSGRLGHCEYWATSWGYSSAFDRVSPDLVGGIWQLFGVPPRILNSFLDMWGDMDRYVEMSGEISAQCVHTTDSIPQGDP
eukprot:13135487-Alexandrium_andersonii.AAC.1